MSKIEISPIHHQMIAAFGHDVEVYVMDTDRPFVGKCVNYTQPLDNEPEIASIDIQVAGYSCLFELRENEIKSIIIKD